MTPIHRDLIRTLQSAVLRQCEERIDKAGKTGVTCYHDAGYRATKTGVTGLIRTRHGL